MANSGKSKPIIAVDVDDVLVQFVPALCDFAYEKWGENITPENYTEDWSKILKVNDVDMIKRCAAEMFADFDFYNNMKAVDGAREILPKLAKKFALVPLTSRIAAQKDLTMNWLSSNFGDIFSEVIFSGAYEKESFENGVGHAVKQAKGDICREIGASYLIDDQPKHVNSAVDCGVVGILFGDYGWNRDAEIVDGVIRVSDWGGVADYFGV